MFTEVNIQIEKAATDLLTAVQGKDENAVRSALMKLKMAGGNISSQSSSKQVALHIACWKDHYKKEVLAILLSELNEGLQLIKDGNGWTAAHYAAYSACEGALRDLLDHVTKNHKVKIGFTDKTAYPSEVPFEKRTVDLRMTPYELVMKYKPEHEPLVRKFLDSFYQAQTLRRKNKGKEIKEPVEDYFKNFYTPRKDTNPKPESVGKTESPVHSQFEGTRPTLLKRKPASSTTKK